jgi:hypothetical protein
MKKTYRHDPKTGKMYLVSQTRTLPKSATVRCDEIERFKSPVDGTIIGTERELLQHNQRNNVSNDLDSLKEKAARQLDYQRNPEKQIDQQKLNKRVAESYHFVEQNPHLFKQ